MGIDNHSFDDAKRITHDYVRCFASHTRQTQQLGHGMRHLVIELRNNALGGGTNIFGLIAIETGGADILL